MQELVGKNLNNIVGNLWQRQETEGSGSSHGNIVSISSEFSGSIIRNDNRCSFYQLLFAHLILDDIWKVRSSDGNSQVSLVDIAGKLPNPGAHMVRGQDGNSWSTGSQNDTDRIDPYLCFDSSVYVMSVSGCSLWEHVPVSGSVWRVDLAHLTQLTRRLNHL